MNLALSYLNRLSLHDKAVNNNVSKEGIVAPRLFISVIRPSELLPKGYEFQASRMAT